MLFWKLLWMTMRSLWSLIIDLSILSKQWIKYFCVLMKLFIILFLNIIICLTRTFNVWKTLTKNLKVDLIIWMTFNEIHKLFKRWLTEIKTIWRYCWNFCFLRCWRFCFIQCKCSEFCWMKFIKFIKLFSSKFFYSMMLILFLVAFFFFLLFLLFILKVFK